MESKKHHNNHPKAEASYKWQQFGDQPVKYNDYEYPKVSIVIPTFNCAHSITPTLKSILAQRYPSFEVIIIDGGSSDRTIEVVKGFRDERLYVYSVTGYNRYEMLNKGIQQATGSYLNFLFPGDYYLSQDVLRHMMTLALDHERPSLVFCGTLLRDGRSEAKILFRHLSPKILRRGQQPTSLQACWFNADLFNVIGKFDPDLNLRGGFDLFCRLWLHGNLKVISTSHVFTDYDLRQVTHMGVLVHCQDTAKIIYRYFGFYAVLKWLFFQKDLTRFLRLWLAKLRVALVGRKSSS